MSQIPTICINSSGWKRAFICNFFFCLFFVNSQGFAIYLDGNLAVKKLKKPSMRHANFEEVPFFTPLSDPKTY